MTEATIATKGANRSLLSRLTAVFVYVLERLMPDPFVFAVLLTFFTAALAYTVVPTATPAAIASAWYSGIFNILAFGFQMVLILVTGYALASSAPVHSLLERIASLADSPRSAVSLTIVIGMIASWTNWGLGLVTAGLLAREIAKRVRMDFGWLVAAAYTGFVISTEGLSGSIVLSQATPGSVLNLVEKVSGHILPLSQTVFSPLNLVPVAALFIILPLIYRWIGPDESRSLAADPERLKAEDQRKQTIENRGTLGSALDRAWILNLLLAVGALFALAYQWREKGFFLDLNSVILAALSLGLLFHWRPVAYVEAIKSAARVTGPLILQYPIYGGIMGIMTTTGLAGVISKAFLAFSTAHTLPFWTYMSSLAITLFIPSGGGHWAVQGPFVLPAARDLHASFAGTTMAVAMGESVANMIQPFFALPILAIAGIPMRRMMGFMVITFLVALVAFAASLLFLV
ncbi:MAG: short-chain fatty acid transporter [Candidatus Acidiferrales bacterium]